MGQIIDGKKLAARLRGELKEKILRLAQGGYRRPSIHVILLGEDPASKIYVRNKAKACEEVGLVSTIHRLKEEVGQEEVLRLIDSLNQDPEVDGILCQLPLPKHISDKAVIAAIDPAKDVDGFHPINAGRLLTGEKCLLPCTPAGIVYMLKSIPFDFEGKNALVIGRSNIVGKPVSLLLLRENCTVTMAHSRTKNLPEIARQSDLIISSAGQPGLIDASCTNSQQVIIDVSINRGPDGKLTGDVAFDQVVDRVSAISPVPGGVGPMTIAMLLTNSLNAYLMRHGLEPDWT